MTADPRRTGRPGSQAGEPAAWRLLQALTPGDTRARDSVSGATLRIGEGGRWETDPPADRAAADLLDLFLPLRTRSAFVVGQLGQSVDGRIATLSGHSHYINGPEDIRRLHRLRALVDAVVVGAGTVSSDDPRLTVREVEGPNPVRVILDPSGRVPRGSRILTDGAARTLWLRAAGDGTPAGSARREPPPGAAGAADGPRAPHRDVEVVALPPGSGGGFAPREVLRELAGRGLRRILVEGGGVTVSGFLAAGVLDRLHLSVAPLILGSGRPGLQLPVIETLDQALRPPVRHFRLGSDLLFDLDLSTSRG